MDNPVEQPTDNVNEQENAPTQEGLKINQVKLNAYIEGLKAEQNVPLGIGAGFAAAIIGAIIWAAVTVATEYQIAYMAIAVGFIVGFAIRYVGKGFDQIFGISGGILALFGCFLGNFLSIIGFVANSEGLGYFETLGIIDFSALPEIISSSFDPMDLLFYGIAIYTGYKFAFREVTEEEIIEHAAE